MILTKEHPRVIHYRSVEPLLTPDLQNEHRGIVAIDYFKAVLTGGTILASLTNSMSIKEWLTTGSEWHVLIFRIYCVREE